MAFILQRPNFKAVDERLIHTYDLNIRMIENSVGTKDRLLDAAEKLFAESGIDAVSLRTITSEAGVNLAAVNYHFQSKEALAMAVVERRFGPINRERLRMLDEFEASAAGNPVPVPQLVEAFVAPVLALKEGPASAFVPLMARIYSEQRAFAERIFRDQLFPVAQRFHAAFERSLPHLPPAEILWRIQFLAGAMVHAIRMPIKLTGITPDWTEPSDARRLAPLMITFFTAAFEAPATEIPDAAAQ
jgi:AcrR family transcriptional regulator